MKFTLSWLKDHLDTTASLEEITTALVRLGLEVEGVENPADKLAPFLIAHILEAEKHPNADKLRVCKVDIGQGEPVQVVCGAPNARAGMKAVFGPPGAYVPGLDVTLKISAIRGVESRGMMCSGRELELSEDSDGILDLPADAPVGTSYVEWLGLNDPVIEIAITPNRQDCLGVAGIARDLAAAGLGTLKTPAVTPVAGAFENPVPIRIEDSDGCPVFLGRLVRGVKNGPSPEWLARRLKAIGLRPISALVDITQYVMIDRGRPLHVYDLAKLTGGLTARRGKPGEELLALNGKTYALDETMVVIADDARALGLGGIMGGEESGCTETTTDVVIECAAFDPVRIGVTGRKLGLTSDARARFERGIDPAFIEPGMELATRMVLDLCGGEASTVTKAGAVPAFDRSVVYNPARAGTLGGVAVPEAEQEAALTRLGFTIESKAAGAWIIRVPSWRKDVDGAADIVEEVLRLVGYDRIPSTPLPRAEGVARPTATFAQLRQRRARRAAAARGFHEAVTWSFIAPAEAEPFGGGAFTLDNPISADMAVMRPSLLPGLIRAAARNRDRGAASVRLFEVGKRYLTEGEKPTLALVAAGEKQSRHWQAKAAAFDVFDAKAEALAVLEAAGAPVERLQVTVDAPAWFHPGRSGTLRLDPRNPIAHFGELHPKVAKALDIKGAVIAVEIYLDAIPQPKQVKRARPKYAPSDLMPVSRDFAFVVKADVEAGKLVQAVKGADKQAITAVEVFDVFQGPGVEEDHKSIALAVTLQPGAASFTDADLEAISGKIIAAAGKVGATLRA
ncbi:phenylalanine--tRNA ligase subunit beta [Pedomonas sp. V897]|uniref:phenylalanine--tRNA ligase subunit beta n=1 Tax=Pedomonas sp. V897 TaxID=3446482 RepID=UPI003EE2DD1F